jgi:hypothetical protein
MHICVLGAFKVISRTTLPPLKPRPPANSPFKFPRPIAVRQQLFHYQTLLHNRDPLIIYPDPDASLDALRIINAAHLPVSKPPPFPGDASSSSLSGEAGREETEVVAMTKRMRIRSRDDNDGTGSFGSDDDSGEDDRTLDNDLTELPPIAPTWVVRKARLIDGVPQLVPPVYTPNTKGKGKVSINEDGGGPLTRDDTSDAATSVERIEACAMGIDGSMLVGASNHGKLYMWLAVKR